MMKECMGLYPMEVNFWKFTTLSYKLKKKLNCFFFCLVKQSLIV